MVIKQDIPVICKRVDTFPNGIKEAFDAIFKEFGMVGRENYGISYMDEKFQIVYQVAVTEKFDGEADGTNYESYTIRKGDWLCVTLTDWMSKTGQIKDVFGQLMRDPRVDKTSIGLEWYKSDKEMQCMMRLF